MDWILVVLVAIFFELLWVILILAQLTSYQSGLTPYQSGLTEQLLRELKEIREEMHWFGDNNFAGHLFKELKENCQNLDQINRSLNSIGNELSDASRSLSDLTEIASRSG